MNYAESVKQHAAAHPFIVERWSITGRWLFIGERKTRESAEQLIEHYRAYPAYANDEYRIVDTSKALDPNGPAGGEPGDDGHWPEIL